MLDAMPTRSMPTPRAPARKQLVARLRKYTPRTMDTVVAYIGRADGRNKVNAVENGGFLSVGGTRELDALANALEVRPSWTNDLASALSYLMFADRLDYFWHHQFRVLYPDRAEPLRMMDWEPATISMALGFVLGWNDHAVYQGYLAHALLNRGFHLAEGFEERHRRGHAFMLRLFAAARNDGTGHRFPQWAHSVPVYEQLLRSWRDPAPENLAPLLIEACDHHLEQGKLDTSQEFFDFGDDRVARVPVEVLMLLRLRESAGLRNPRLDHPLMEAPFDALPAPVPMPEPDELMRGALARARADWPNMDSVLSLDSIRAAAKLGA
jgi:hypothetical protein